MAKSVRRTTGHVASMHKGYTCHTHGNAVCRQHTIDMLRRPAVRHDRTYGNDTMRVASIVIGLKSTRVGCTLPTSYVCMHNMRRLLGVRRRHLGLSVWWRMGSKCWRTDGHHVGSLGSRTRASRERRRREDVIVVVVVIVVVAVMRLRVVVV